MKVSEFIAELQKIQQEHGDLDVETYGYDGRYTHGGPSYGNRKILKERESRPEFWRTFDDEYRRGEPVCRV